MKSDKTIIITMGDPRGVGPEVICKALKGLQRTFETTHKAFENDFSRPWRTLAEKNVFKVLVVGDKKILGRLPASVSIMDVPYKKPGEGALKFLQTAINLIKQGGPKALVTAPLSKEAVSVYTEGFVGHTEYLAQAFGVKHFDMMFITDHARLSIVTRHVPLKDVPALITKKTVFDSIILMAQTLKQRFKITNPKIAVLGLNPHAGEHGLLGREDMLQILPAILKAKRLKINAIGPLPADTFFSFSNCYGYDGIVAMYHDQGLSPFKALYMKQLVNFTAGLPFVRTSPAHGTAFDIAGKNKADPSSMIAAIKLACQLL